MAKISREEMEINKEQLIYFIKQYIKKNGYAPVYREIADGTGFTLDTIFRNLRALRSEGRIDFIDGKPRTIKIK